MSKHIIKLIHETHKNMTQHVFTFILQFGTCIYVKTPTGNTVHPDVHLDDPTYTINTFPSADFLKIGLKLQLHVAENPHFGIFTSPIIPVEN